MFGDYKNMGTDKTAKWSVILTFVLLGIGNAVAEEINLDSLSKFSESRGAVELSTDGFLVAFERAGNVIVTEKENPANEVDLGEGIAPLWAPDGKKLAFYSTRSGARQLWVWDRGEDNPKQITKFEDGIDPDPSTRISGGVEDAFRYSWAPDGSTIIFPSRVAYPASRAIGNQDNPKRNGNDVDVRGPIVLTKSTPHSATLSGVMGERVVASGVPEVRRAKTISLRDFEPGTEYWNQLFEIDLLRHAVRQLTSAPKNYFHPAHAPDGVRLAVIAMEGSLTDLGDQNVALIEWNLTNDTERIIRADSRIKYKPRWSSSSNTIAYLSLGDLFDKPVVDLMDANTGDFLHRVSKFDRHIYDFAILSDAAPEKRASIVVRYKDGVSTKLGLLDAEAGKIEDLSGKSSLPHRVTSFSVAANGQLIWRQTDPTHLTTIIHATVGSPPEILKRLNGEAKAFALGEVKTVSWRDKFGRTKEGSVLLPSNYDASRRYPVIVDVYPQRDGADWSNPIASNYAWASWGFVVFRPAPRAPHAWVNPWKSFEKREEAMRSKGWELATDDVESGLDELVRQGIADPNAICLYGHSNGGAVVAQLIGQTDRFACAVIVAPAMTNWVRFPLLNPEFDDWIERWAGGVALENAVDEYIALSPVFRLQNVTTPVLIAVGDNDRSFLLNSVEVYNRLRQNNAEVTLLRYPNQGHIFRGDALEDFWTRVRAFFEIELKD